MISKCLLLILALGVVFVAAGPYYYDTNGNFRCTAVGHCIYEHATCPSRLVLPNAWGCHFRRKCCATDLDMLRELSG